MRPVERGPHPEDSAGLAIVFTEYGQSRRFLIDALGGYCCYCERKIDAGLHVEHVKPKDSNPNLALVWTNFLLGCVNCNSNKGNEAIQLADYVWPDVDATFECFSYTRQGEVIVGRQVRSPALRTRIEKTIRLFGLQKGLPTVGTREWMKASDRRQELRKIAVDNAYDYADTYRLSPPDDQQLIQTFMQGFVREQGFWSIWMKAFENFPEMTTLIENCIPGTRLTP